MLRKGANAYLTLLCLWITLGRLRAIDRTQSFVMWMNDWLALHLAIVSGIQGREPALQRASLSQENQCNIVVPGFTEDDVRSDLQKHTAKTLNESNVAIVLLNLLKDWAVWKRNNVSGSDVFNPLNNQLTIWKARNTSDPKNPSCYFLNPQI